MYTLTIKVSETPRIAKWLLKSCIVFVHVGNFSSHNAIDYGKVSCCLLLLCIDAATPSDNGFATPCTVGTPTSRGQSPHAKFVLLALGNFGTCSRPLLALR